MSYVFYTVFLHNKARKKMIKNLKEKTFTVLIGKKKTLLSVPIQFKPVLLKDQLTVYTFPSDLKISLIT